MYRHGLTALALALTLLTAAAAQDADKEAGKGDKQLQGAWEATKAVRDGQEQPAPEGGPVVLTFKGNDYTVKVGDNTMKGTFKVEAGKAPRAIDSTPADGPNKGKTSKGIYEVKGDQLRLCFAQPGKERPTTFDAKEGSGHFLVTLKRVKK